MDTGSLLALRDVSKSYAGEQAVAGVTLEIEHGTVHGLVGENGAGKSTLVKMMTGVIQPDAGRVALHGKPVGIRNSLAARKAGVVAMYQEPTVFDHQTVGENIFAGRQPVSGLRLVNWRRMRRLADDLLRNLGANFDSRTIVGELGIADRQLVEIAKALSVRASLLIMDEPTAALSPTESTRLFNIVRALRNDGTAIVFISHRLNEVLAVADTVTILRDGERICTKAARELALDEIVRLMVGRPLTALFPTRKVAVGDPILTVTGLTQHGTFDDVSFSLRRGEIVGLAGFVGAGRTEVARAIFGLDRIDAGTITVNGRLIRRKSPRAAIEHGVAYLPEDRLRHGLLRPMSIEDNIGLPALPSLSKLGFVEGRRQRSVAVRAIEALQIKATSPRQVVDNLSGGNQQKVVVGKWLATEPRVLLLDEPTHGIDVGAKAEVHRAISALAEQGLAILLISSELSEILGMSDRILVMHEGSLVAEIDRADATEERVVRAAAGLTEDQ